MQLYEQKKCLVWEMFSWAKVWDTDTNEHLIKYILMNVIGIMRKSMKILILDKHFEIKNVISTNFVRYMSVSLIKYHWYQRNGISSRMSKSKSNKIFG